MEIIILEQEDKTKVERYPCVTCMWAGHKQVDWCRPTCIKLFDYNGNCMQICEECLEKIYSDWKKLKEKK